MSKGNKKVLETIQVPDREYYYARPHEDLEYGNRVLPSMEKGEEMIEEYIKTEKPFMIARLGETEQRVVAFGVLHDFPIYNPIRRLHILKCECRNWCEGAGFFPRKVNMIPQFTELYLEAFQETNVLAVWGLEYEQFFLNQYMPDAKLCRARNLAVVEQDKVWTKVLKGRKVLVISPFAKSIKAQYLRRKMIHNNIDLLPEFDLKTIKAVQSPIITGEKSNFKNWFQAFEWMYEETLKIDYDIALLGCGAYAFPLAAKIKQSGHGAITTCGGTQLLFGIMGRRWDDPKYKERIGVNEYWVYPSDEETPKKVRMVENSCYWK